jgi:alkanesulfonate monooxygenase SsuD/methylene tetrahydromethanopterin reductase-like flavin-dependent oxidoreductase (luciferase family)
MANTPLTVLDLVPISSGSTAAQALRNSIDLAQQAERFGYARYWFAEHHLNPGVASTSPAVILALATSATSRIRIGSGAVQLGHRTALSVVEEFGLLDALYPGRLDLGLGRSGGRPPTSGPEQAGEPSPASEHSPATGRAAASEPSGRSGQAPVREHRPATVTAVANGRAPNGLRIPRRISPERLRGSPMFKLQEKLLRQPGAEPQGYAEQIADILALLNGTYRRAGGGQVHIVPGQDADVQVWVLGSSGGESAQVAGANGLRFAANYHVSPATVLEAAEGYRAAFRPNAELDRPHISVSADVVAADDEATARELATGYGLWVRSIRRGEGAIEFPTPDEARAHAWTDEERELVADRVETQFVGTPGQVADQLEQLREATGADELIVTTITHDHADRVRSYQLLADEWRRRGR